MPSLHESYNFLADILAKAEPGKIMAFKASDEMERRYLELANKNKITQLSPNEIEEIQGFLALERIIRLAKIKADIILNSKL